ncbi:MAG: hypothetical protein GY953_36560, partial [bacterium]|nr:hypothetical protein [bacterium]
MKYELGEYLAAWLLYLRDVEKFPIKYISLHNEGEARRRWPADGSIPNWEKGHDYNLYWPPEQVVDFLGFLPGMLQHFGLDEIGVTPGETTSWKYFTIDGYGSAIAMNPLAFRNIGLVTSHSFNNQAVGGVDTLRWRDIQNRSQRELKVWVTSTSWSKMTVDFISQWTKDLYDVRVNALIPWACVQTDTWVGGDPNPGTAFRVDRKGGWKVEPGYFYYKQVTRAGQPGTRVAGVVSNDKDIHLMAFARARTEHPDAFVVMNTSETEKKFRMRVKGSSHRGFAAWRTSESE